MSRKIKKGLILSNGQEIKSGTHVRVPGALYDRFDAVEDGFADFDGLRWSRLREASREDSKFAWNTAG